MARRITNPNLLSDCQNELLDYFNTSGYIEVYEYEQQFWSIINGINSSSFSYL